MKIGLFGCGVVGSGVCDIIMNTQNQYLKNFEIKKILTKSRKELHKGLMALNADEILNDRNIDLVIEVMGGIHPAYEYIMKALNSGKHVVTANKAVVAKYLKEFTIASKKNNVAFLYEPSVCGGIPWLKSVKQVRRIDEITKISGIFNGTSNFILYNMFEKGYDFNDILKVAQIKGYAEADPSADIDGIDIQRKLSIVSSLAFDAIIPEEDIPYYGIRYVTKKDINYFKEKGLVLKLFAKSVKVNNSYCCCVEPVLFLQNSIEANVSQNYNIGSITGSIIGELKFYGQGAGKLPTANALVQDIIDIHTKEFENYSISLSNNLKLDKNLISGKYYIRFSDKKAFAYVKDIVVESFESGGHIFVITRKITLEKAQDIFREISKYDRNFLYARFEDI